MSRHRRSARRWAKAWPVPGSAPEPEEAEEKPLPPVKERGEIHPVETLISGLVDPTHDEMAKRAQEYER
jgi:hypothetical protein